MTAEFKTQVYLALKVRLLVNTGATTLCCRQALSLEGTRAWLALPADFTLKRVRSLSWAGSFPTAADCW